MTALRTPSSRVTTDGVRAMLADLPPLIDPELAAADCAEFEEKWKDSATPEELQAEAEEQLRDQIRTAYEAPGATLRSVARDFGKRVEQIHRIVDPEWAAQETERKTRNSRNRRERLRAVAA